jgi:hypothetical protein
LNRSIADSTAGPTAKAVRDTLEGLKTMFAKELKAGYRLQDPSRPIDIRGALSATRFQPSLRKV